MKFDFQPTLHSEQLTIRPLVHSDLSALRSAAADPQIWQGHPAKNRHESEVFDPYFHFLLKTHRALIIEETVGRVIGTSSYYSAPDGRNELAIGFTFLTRDHWGGSTNFEVKRLMLGHVFALQDVTWFHIDPSNVRSQTATCRLGAIFVEDASLDLGNGEAKWKCYRLEKEVWAKVLASRSN